MIVADEFQVKMEPTKRPSPPASPQHRQDTSNVHQPQAEEETKQARPSYAMPQNHDLPGSMNDFESAPTSSVQQETQSLARRVALP